MAGKSCCILAFLFLCLTQTVNANPHSFKEFIQGVQKEASATGISPEVVNLLSKQSKPFKKLGLKKQSTVEIPKYFGQYLTRIVTDQKLNQLADIYKKYRKPITDIARFYNVQSRFILATWALTSDNGNNDSSYQALSVYASKAFESNEVKFKDQLLMALKVIESGKINIQDFKSDNRGYMGQLLFTPKLFAEYAQDWDKDGKFDIWHNKLDSLATVAFFLRKNGWKRSLTWGRQVVLKQKIPESGGSTKPQPFTYWTERGVTKYDGSKLPNRAGIQASLVKPLATDNRFYLVYSNFNILTQWPDVDKKRALAISYLSEKLKPILRKK